MFKNLPLKAPCGTLQNNFNLQSSCTVCTYRPYLAEVYACVTQSTYHSGSLSCRMAFSVITLANKVCTLLNSVWKAVFWFHRLIVYV